MENNVLILGAGMVVQPIVDYLLDNNIRVTLASRTLQKAQKAIHKHPLGKAVAWTTEDLPALEDLIIGHDLTVSLLPYAHHVSVAKLCLRHKKNMVTTSYVSKEMRAVDQAAKNAGIIILNEIGLDPGFDHMTAMRIIDRVRTAGGKIESFYSFCGALAAPEAADNPFKYKFSWSPKGVIMAGNNDAKYIENGKEVLLDTKDLFKNPIEVDFPEIGKMDVYPNRDSIPYIEIYGIPEVKTMYRGTFRYKGWCETMDVLKTIGLTRYEVYDLNGLNYADFVSKVSGIEKGVDIKKALCRKYNINPGGTAVKAMEWLGLFSNKTVRLRKGSPFDVLSDLMIEKMMLGKNERDMVIMQHDFTVLKSDGTKEKTVSRFLDFGDDKYTSIAKTVALPAAVAVKMILDKKINVTGVHIPASKSFYEPILTSLEDMGIKMTEESEIAD